MARALSVRGIDNLKPHKTRRQEIPDGAIAGLYLLVQPSGSKSWAVRYRRQGKPAKLTLGPYPRLGLAEARQAARETLGIVSVGNDPTADRVTLARLKRLPAPDGAREFATVLDRFLRSQRTKGRRSTDKVKALLDKDATAYWRHRQIADITAADVHERIEAIVSRGAPVAASRFRAWASKLFNFAVKAQLRPDNPAAATENPVDAKARQRKRVLDDRELVLVWKAADNLGYPFGRAVQLLILTGQRLNEVCAAPRSEFDFEARRWVIASERAKNGIEHLVPLSVAASDIIASLPVIAGGDLLFTTTGWAPISGFSKAKRRLDALATELNDGQPLPHWTLHDLRRTFSSGWARLRVPTEVTEKALNHVSGSFGGVSGIYNRFDYADERAEAMEAWARCIVALVDGKSLQNVVPLRPVVA
jgi:integrase